MEPIAILQEQKILLLYGGWSAERNISINSGTAVAGALNRNDISFSEYDLTSEEEAKLLSTDYDLAFIALHGRGGEDGFIQEILESKNIKYTGSDTLSCKTSLNKIESKKIWRDLLLPTPDFVEIVNVSVNVPVFSTRITKSVSPPGSALWSFVTSSALTPYVGLVTASSVSTIDVRYNPLPIKITTSKSAMSAGFESGLELSSFPSR